MSEKFCVSLLGEGVQRLKELLSSTKVVQELEIEAITEEIVNCLIEAQVTIHSLIVKYTILDGPLLKKLLTSVTIDNIIVSDIESCLEEPCDFECDHMCEKEHFDPKKEEKKDKEGIVKIKEIDLHDQATLEEITNQLVDESTRVVKFKGSPLPEEFALWIATELVDGELSHIDEISISKDPKTVDLLKGRELSPGLRLEPKKKDGISILRAE